jgi:EpsI family protein
MIARRDLVAGLACLGALGTAEWLRPRRELLLMRQGVKLKDIVPLKFAGWKGGDGDDIVIPRVEGSLAARLYNDELGRAYRKDQDGNDDREVMLLAAYGRSQSDSLQLHRPEVCYPANGFQITYRGFVDIAAGTTAIPGVALTAVAGERIEDIVYWTRLGTRLPRTASEQRSDRLKEAMAGNVPDGILMRASMVRVDSRPAIEVLRVFLSELISATAPDNQPALIGRKISAA